MTNDDSLDELDYEMLENRWVVRKQGYSEDDWVAAFRRHRLPSRLRPSRTVTAYRGATTHGQRGMSWTTDRATAQEYAGRAGALWQTRIRPGMILAVIERQAGWSELVVDPAKLGDIDLADTEEVRTSSGLLMKRGVALLDEENRKDERARERQRQRRADERRADESRERMRERVAAEVDRQRRPARRPSAPSPKRTVLSRMFEEERAKGTQGRPAQVVSRFPLAHG